MKNYVKGFLSAILFILLSTSVLATTVGNSIIEVTLSPELSINLNGIKLELKDEKGNNVYPVIYKGTTYLPVRALSENLGLDVGWDGETKTVILKGIVPDNEINDDTTTELKSLIGIWTRKGKNSDRAYTELLTFTSELTYTIQARYDDDNSLVAEVSGTYTYDSTVITYTNSDLLVGTENYSITDNETKLVINGIDENPWKKY